MSFKSFSTAQPVSAKEQPGEKSRMTPPVVQPAAPAKKAVEAAPAPAKKS
ncbi:MAG: hypothetical protein WD715_03280 [Dongiaceae bacterium]